MNLSPKKAPGTRKVVSVGPETEKRAPGAKVIKFKYWRPLAVALLAVSAQVYNEDWSPINSAQVPKETNSTVLESHGSSFDQEAPQNLLFGSFTIKEPQDSPDKIISQSISQTPVNPQAPIDQSPTAAPDQNNDAKIQALGYSNPTQENNPQELEAQKVSRVKIWLTSAGWPQDLQDQAVVVVKCESTYNPIAKNGSFKGLFGLDENWFKYFGVDPELWADPEVNARVAYQVYQYDLERNQAPWTQWDPACRPK